MFLVFSKITIGADIEMKSLKKSIISVLYKLEHVYQKFSLISILFIADILLIMGDFTFMFVVPEIAPMIFTIVIVMYFCKKYKEHDKFKSFIRITNSLIFYNYTFVWVYPFPKNS